MITTMPEPYINIIEYDATNEVCPVPLVKMRMMLKKMAKGEVLTLKIVDSGSKKDIPKYLKQMSYHYVTKEIDFNAIEVTIRVH
jgi:TusA-related sulfurtransferase